MVRGWQGALSLAGGSRDRCGAAQHGRSRSASEKSTAGQVR